ncbi:aKG-HExxH-type peptide beta-hydroxylase [Thioalkalivibrio paradoxus]|uniref:HEXXH motif domain-containing protein n=1 Tax=Thioalkalivibrio paradoxus ARh 1 TaxID=713585 RepID=W0DT18_9GAMM|nr:HEXXH motif-containing putative peptide modification protein [Thioalkalivibrio paradoxus]AHF00124.1 hypothetical protein THITH_09925 [Thioalkalivibrio paradoxus ARh 1]
MTIHLQFEPDPGRAVALDRRMHQELGNSLTEVCGQARGSVAFDAPCMEALIDGLRGDAVHAPTTFGLYYDLVLALLGGDRGEAERLFAILAEVAPVSTEPAIRGLEAPGASSWSDLYRAKMSADLSDGIEFLPPSREVVGRFRERHAIAMAMMDRAVPELAAEVRALVRDTVCVTGAPDAKMSFQGGSHYQLWGALFLNAEYHDSPLALAEVIAHESAHSLLFGFCIEEPLVFNKDEELYPSPLREDPRPMDGIYHATFVSARMHWAMSRLLDSGMLSAEERRLAAAARDNDAENFDAGHRVVAEHARMSGFAAELMEGARAYMAVAAR